MILIKKIYIRIFTFLAFVCIIGLGSYIYFHLNDISTINPIFLKFISERIFFFSIIFSILLILAFYYLIYKQENNIYEELDKIKEYSQKGNINKISVQKLGKLGEKIMLLNDKLSDLNDKRVEKITSLSKEINFLYNLIDVPVFSVNMKGEIDKVSKNFINELKYDKKDIIDKSVTDIVTDVNFNALTQELKQSKMVPLKSSLSLDPKEDGEKKYFVFYPIFNVKNKLTNSICIMVDKAEYDKLQTGTVKDVSEENGTSPLLKRLFDLH
jgi:transcriptional regulator with PAS, ATPase and Fis domain